MINESMLRSSSASCVAAAGSLAVALGLAIAAASFYSPPNLLGFSGQRLSDDPAFWCVAASTVLSWASGVIGARSARRTRRISAGETLGVALAGAALAFFLLVVWWSYVLYFALLLAPSQAFASAGLYLCLRAHRLDRSQRLFDEPKPGAR